MSLYSFSSTSVANLCSGKYKSIWLPKTECCGNIFLFQNVFIIFGITDCSLLILYHVA